MAGRLIWSHPYGEQTNVNAFRHYVNRKHSLDLQGYSQLHEWSVNNIEYFAWATWTFCGIKYSVPPTSAGIGLDTMYPRPKWFPGARINYADNIISPGVVSKPDAVAITAYREGSFEVDELTFKELEREVARWANTFRKMGVVAGDRIATVLTNHIDVIVIFLAASSVGAIFSSTSPDMGVKGIVERFSQLKPKLLVCETEVVYGGRTLDLRTKLEEANRQLEQLVPELQCTIVVRGPLFAGRNIESKDDILQNASVRISYEQLPFDHPIFILYTSGTTGPPKCICHSAGGALLQTKKEAMFANDIGPNTVYYQYTTAGWMMWNYMITALSLGARIVLYDGSPLYPSVTSQLELIERQRVTYWGTSPKFLSALRKVGLPRNLKLDSLITVGSAGSPLNPELYEWFYQNFRKTISLASASGGTDLVGGIVEGSPLANIYSGEISVAGLGMKVEIWDQGGNNIEDSGEKGDLIISRPFFSMPLTFWGDDGEEKYRKAYFDQFPGVWCHGDFIKKNPKTGGYEILGRSDGVLNPGGVRFGTAEIYAVLDHFPDIEESIAVGQKLAGGEDEQVLLFIKLHANKKLAESLLESIRAAIRKSLSPRHVPAHILQVKDVPYTINGKKMELLVRDIVSGKSPKVVGTAANPECLKEYSQFYLLANRDTPKSKL